MLKFLRLVVLSLFFCFIILSYSKAEDPAPTTASKYPNQELGIGFQIGSPGQFGVVGSFAINQDFHIGAHFGFIYASGYTTGSIEYPATNILVFAPFAKIYLLPMRTLRPFIKGSFEIMTGNYSFASSNRPQNVTNASSTTTSIVGQVGAEWFGVKSVGVFAGINVLALNLDPFQVTGGIGEPFIGIQWFVFN